MKTIQILGGAGFIGKNLITYLVKSGYQVSCMDHTKIENPCKGVSYIQGDFFDEKELKSVIKGKDCVIHAVSTLNPGNSNELYMQGYEKDFIQTVRLCRMLIGTTTKLIFLSSGGTVYGVHDDQPISEDVIPHPINHYGNIKLCIENTMRSFNYQTHNKMLIVRISNPYGPGQDFTKGVGFIDAALKQALNEKPVEIWGDGENVRDYIYIEDVCKMICSLLEYSGPYDTFNISSGIGYSQNEVVELIRRQGLDLQVVYKGKRSIDIKKIILDNSRIKTVWRYQPMSLEKGMQKYLKYLQQTI